MSPIRGVVLPTPWVNTDNCCYQQSGCCGMERKRLVVWVCMTQTWVAVAPTPRSQCAWKIQLTQMMQSIFLYNVAQESFFVLGGRTQKSHPSLSSSAFFWSGCRLIVCVSLNSSAGILGAVPGTNEPPYSALSVCLFMQLTHPELLSHLNWRWDESLLFLLPPCIA